MTRKFIHAVVPYNATADQANMVTDLLEGRGLPFSPNNPTMEIRYFDEYGNELFEDEDE